MEYLDLEEHYSHVAPLSNNMNSCHYGTVPPIENGTELTEAMIPALPELITLWLGGGMDTTVADLWCVCELGTIVPEGPVDWHILPSFTMYKLVSVVH